jgi:hypothetical protein
MVMWVDSFRFNDPSTDQMEFVTALYIDDKNEENPMLMIETPQVETPAQLDYAGRYDELNRLLSAAVVSKSFRNVLLTSPEVALSSGYQGEKFNLSDADRSWLFSIKPTSLVDLAANMVTYQQNLSQECPVTVPLQRTPHYVRVN